MKKFCSLIIAIITVIILTGCNNVETTTYSKNIFDIQNQLISELNTSSFSPSNKQKQELDNLKLENDTFTLGFIGSPESFTFQNEQGETTSIFKSFELLISHLFELDTELKFYDSYTKLNEDLVSNKIHLSPFSPTVDTIDEDLLYVGPSLFQKEFYMVFNTNKIDSDSIDFDNNKKEEFISNSRLGNANRDIDNALLNSGLTFTSINTNSYPYDVDKTISELESNESHGYDMFPVYDIFDLEKFLNYDNMGYFKLNNIVDLDFSGISTSKENMFIANMIEKYLIETDIINLFDELLGITRTNTIKYSLNNRLTDEEIKLIEKINNNGGIDVVNDADHPTFSSDKQDNSSLVNIVLNDVSKFTSYGGTKNGLNFNLIDSPNYEDALNNNQSLSISYNYLNTNNSNFSYTKSFAADSIVVLAHIDSDISISSNTCSNDLRYGRFGNYRNYSESLYSELGIISKPFYYDNYYEMSLGHQNKDFDFMLVPEHTYLYRRNADLVYFSEIVCTLDNVYNSHNFILQNTTPSGYTEQELDTLNSILNKSMDSLDSGSLFDEWIGVERNINNIIYESNQVLFFSGALMNVLLAAFISLIIISTVIRLRTYKIKDSLTGLHNRAYMSFLYNAKGKMNDKPLAFIDVDKFKRINDTHGHHIGDLVLKRIGFILLEFFESTEVFRISGDEFVVISHNPDPLVLKSKLDLVSSKLDTSITIFNTNIELSIKISIGIAEPSLMKDKSLNDILDIADKLMYFNKSGTPFLLPNGSNNGIILKKIDAIKNINSNIFTDIEVRLNKVYDFHTKQVVGYETISLMKIDGVEIKFYDYEKYISNMISYTAHVYRTAMTLFKKLALKDDFITIYVSQLSLELLSKTTFEITTTDNNVILELNEGTELSNSSIRYIQKLHKKGYKFLISNFEGGHSSLISLRHSEFEFLKLKNKLIDSNDNNRSSHLLEFVEGFTEVFNVKLFIDNIDSKETYLKYSKSKNISFAQGSYFSDLKEEEHE